MSTLAIVIVLGCQIFLVAGQLLLKRAMTAVDVEPRRWSYITPRLAGGVALLTIWFFLWLGLLQTWELTRLFPFEAISPILLAFGAWYYLNEKLSARAWVGVALIGIGVTLVANG